MGVGALDRADGDCRRRSPVPHGGEEWGTDHILTTKRYDRGRPIYGPTVIPCRDPTSGIRHGFDVVTHAGPFNHSLRLQVRVGQGAGIATAELSRREGRDALGDDPVYIRPGSDHYEDIHSLAR